MEKAAMRDAQRPFLFSSRPAPSATGLLMCAGEIASPAFLYCLPKRSNAKTVAATYAYSLAASASYTVSLSPHRWPLWPTPQPWRDT